MEVMQIIKIAILKFMIYGAWLIPGIVIVIACIAIDIKLDLAIIEGAPRGDEKITSFIIFLIIASLTIFGLTVCIWAITHMAVVLLRSTLQIINILICRSRLLSKK